MGIDEVTLLRAIDAATQAFRDTIESAVRRPVSGEDRPPRLERHLAQYPPDSWKAGVLTIIKDLIGDDEDAIFTSSDFSTPCREKELARRHPKHTNIRSGVAVTLQGLMADKIIERVARGRYRLR